MLSAAILSTLLHALPVAAAPAGAVPVRRALIIAYNGSNRPGVPDLQYADDDGVRWLEVFRRLGVDAELLTVPDAETAAADPGLLQGVREPSRAGVQAAAQRLAERIRSDHAGGAVVDAFLVYVGHGQTDEAGKASLTLLDGTIDQQAFYETLVDPLDADFVHVLVDACHAAGVVGSRGADPRVLDQLRATLEREVLARRPRVGALYAESLDGTTHEWSKIRAGVLSHVLRSGLLGGPNAVHALAAVGMDSFTGAGSTGWLGSVCVLPSHVDRPRHGSFRGDCSRALAASVAGSGRAGAGPVAGLARGGMVDQPAAHSPARPAERGANDVPAESFPQDLGVF